ncbi:hypothetical protein QVD17_28065 [Tagetes erecta]|uniref:NB-ARC n=1 Tax=Tagetes erecta TaxID=13708 RepID=A0AAD8K9Q5_TARER|nr:hypothetical protein QVD17_28065 [Tagetes erecta]
MAELVLSALLPVLFDKLASTTLKTIARNKGIDAEVAKLQESLKDIQDVLTDASQKEITNQSVKRWLHDLQHLAYDIDDMLDKLATEAMDREFNRESEVITSKVRKLIPSCCKSFSQRSRMHDKLDVITTRLQDLVKDRTSLGLRVEKETGPRNINRTLQTCVFDPSSIVGRKTEKDTLVQQLLAGEPCDQNFSIVPIFGMGGIGKTTLARLLYDEKQVKDHFELKAWVCVSDEFDSFRISKEIFEAMTKLNKEFTNFNLLQEALRDHLMGKRFMLVLDDIWSELYADWETLVRPFYTCAPGSKIIITTRKDQLVKQLVYNPLNKQLQSLSDDDALSLVALNALGVNNFDSHLSLKPYAEGIVKKCGGLPLALIALGRLLRTKIDKIEHWKEVLNSEIWRLKDGGGILPALRLSYHDLSAPLKQLFAYCSLFPKDFLFDKEELVLLWMAEGFLHQASASATEEHLGHEYFNELLSKSFFQHAPNSESLFVMHDLMNDLATYVASEFYVRFGNETEKNIRASMLEKYRHMSFVREEHVAYKKFQVFERATSLRTFFVTFVGVVDIWQHCYLSNKILVDLLPKLQLLRVLCLRGFQISEGLDSIGTLKHLRYLNLSHTKITHLPESVCDLYNLETLIVFSCRRLTKLPSSFLKLKKLRHLDIRDTPLLDKMPLGISELKNLQTLSKIIIGCESRFELAKLKVFKNLCGKISIVGLDKVQSTRHAQEANFSQKRLSELEVVWSDKPYDSRNEILEKDILNKLKPCNEHLTQLKIVSYGGSDFPSWIGDPLFLHLKHVSLRDCKRCTSLPPLGQLLLLKELFIEGLYGVEIVGLELLGVGGAFPSLEILSFKDMLGWKKWSANAKVFPHLKQLLISNCPSLVEVTLQGLPTLNVLKLYGCPNLVEVSLGAIPSLNALKMIKCDSGVLRRMVEVASSVTKLDISLISGLNDVVWRGVIEHLEAVEELKIAACDEIRYLWESETVASKVLMSLRKLEVFSCGNLVSLGEKDWDNRGSNNLISLRMLEVFGCDNMERCSCPNGVETLRVEHCSSITAISLPMGEQKLKSLKVYDCKKLLDREWRGQKIPMLEYVWIQGLTNLKSIIELNYLVHLTKLRIEDCESLESFPGDELPSLTSLKSLTILSCPCMGACFPLGVWPPNLCSLSLGKLKKPISEWGTQKFPASTKLIL